LFDKGLLTSATLEKQAAEAQGIINRFGILPEQNFVQPSHWFLNVPIGIAVTFANAYAGTSVLSNLCGYSFGATDATSAVPVPLASTAEAALFATSNGIPPTAGVNLINNDSANGPLENRVSTSPSTRRADQNLDGALCLRALATGTDLVTGKRLRGEALVEQRKIARSIQRILASGDLGGIPTVIVTGRSDAILPPNHTSRAYFGLNNLVEGDASNMHYYEVTNAQHLDALNPVPGFDSRFIPLHHYFIQALDFMLAHLTNGKPLPPSQVVRTTPRGVSADGAVPDLGEANLPPIESTPPDGALITFVDGIVHIPD
jgi:hydroxybutyrate-dimer hydrolase